MASNNDARPDLLYSQVENDLRQQIISGDLGVGEKIRPSSSSANAIR